MKVPKLRLTASIHRCTNAMFNLSAGRWRPSLKLIVSMWLSDNSDTVDSRALTMSHLMKMYSLFAIKHVTEWKSASYRRLIPFHCRRNFPFSRIVYIYIFPWNTTIHAACFGLFYHFRGMFCSFLASQPIPPLIDQSLIIQAVSRS
jgi:hypothetical protein